MRHKAFPCFLLSAGCASLHAQAPDDFEQELLALLNTPVASATKTTGLTTSEAPSVIRVFTREEIEAHGWSSLRELLSHVPGIQMEEYRSGHQVAWVRGVQTRYNNKVLLLLDGVPVREVNYGHFLLDEMLPLELAERVEIINGPGSVLYGANAFAGVISITTKKEGRGVSIGAGTDQLRRAWGEYSGGGAYGFAQAMDTDGFSPELNEDGLAWKHPQDRRARTFFGSYRHQGFSVMAGALGYDHPDTYRVRYRDRAYERQPAFGSASYRFSPWKNGTMNILGYYQSSDFDRLETRYNADGTMNRSIHEVYDTRLQGLDVDLSVAAGKHLLVFGVSYQRDQSVNVYADTTRSSGATTREEGLILPKVARTFKGVFAQDIWKITPHLNVTAGLRFDSLDGFEDKVNTRLGLTGGAGKFYGKALFGTAYRLPSYREYLDVVAYNLDLKPETIRTYELQAGIKGGFYDFNATLYQNSYTNFIKEVEAVSFGPRDIGDEFSLNAENRKITGLEIAGFLSPIKRLTLQLTYTKIFNAKETLGALPPGLVIESPYVVGESDIYFLSKSKATFLATYKWSAFKGSLGAMYVFKRDAAEGYQSDVPAERQNPSNLAGFLKMDAALAFQWRMLRAKAKVENLLDRKIYSPAFDSIVNYDNQWPGRTWRLEAGLQF